MKHSSANTFANIRGKFIKIFSEFLGQITIMNGTAKGIFQS